MIYFCYSWKRVGDFALVTQEFDDSEQIYRDVDGMLCKRVEGELL